MRTSAWIGARAAVAAAAVAAILCAPALAETDRPDAGLLETCAPPADFGPAAAWAWREICAGRDGDLSRFDGEDCGALSGPRRGVSASEIVRMALEPPGGAAQVTLRCARVDGASSFDFRRLGAALLIADSRFEGDVSLHRSEAPLLIALSRVVVRGDFDAEGARFGQGLYVVDARIEGAARFAGLRSHADVDLAGSRIGGDVDLSGAAIAGGAVARGARIEGGLALTGARIAGGLDLTDGSILGGVSGSALRVDGDVAMGGLATAIVDLRAAWVMGRLGVAMAQPERAALDLSGARVGSIGAGLASLGFIDLRGASATFDAAGWARLDPEAAARALATAPGGRAFLEAYAAAASAGGDGATGRRATFAARAAHWASEPSASRRALGLALGAIWGHGAYPERGLMWAAAILCVAGAVAWALRRRSMQEGAIDVRSE